MRSGFYCGDLLVLVFVRPERGNLLLHKFYIKIYDLIMDFVNFYGVALL